jgi:hypothetical protein
MNSFLNSLLISLLLIPQSAISPGRGSGATASGSGGGPTPPGCTAPSYTYRWPLSGTVTCGGGAACSNGGAIDSVLDPIAGNNATQGAPGDRPTYNTAQINGLPAATFTGGTQSLVLTTPIPAATTSMSYYAVINPTVGGNIGFVGNSIAIGGVEWRINGGGHQELLAANVASIAIGSATFSSGKWITIAFTYNTSTGAWTFFNCSGGTCVSDGSGTTAQTFSATVLTLGNANVNFDPYIGKIAEIGALVGSQSVVGLGAYSKCQFNI